MKKKLQDLATAMNLRKRNSICENWEGLGRVDIFVRKELLEHPKPYWRVVAENDK